MKKKVCILVVIVLLIMLIPVKLGLNDGGTRIYRAVLYEVVDMHRFNPEYYDDDSVPMYIEGLRVWIMGIKVYDSTEN